MVNKIALEFAQYVLRQNPKAKSFVAMYDAMSRAATFRSFRNLGREELAGLGISFSLLATEKLEHVIEEARTALSDQNSKTLKPVRNAATYHINSVAAPEFYATPRPPAHFLYPAQNQTLDINQSLEA